MKKIFNLISLSLVMLLIISCKNEEKKTYQNGDRLTIDHIIYEYVVPNEKNYERKAIDAPYYDYKTADIYDPNRPIYHSCYPIDMINPEKFPVNALMFNEENFSENVQFFGRRFGKIGLYEDENGLVQSDMNFIATNADADYFNVISYMDSDYAFYNPCFWVVGCDEELRMNQEKRSEIKIKSIIDDILVVGIGYGAFVDLNGKYKVLVEEADSSKKVKDYYSSVGRNCDEVPLLVMPYAFSNMDISELCFDRQAFIYSLGFNKVMFDSAKFNFRIFLYGQAFYKCELATFSAPTEEDQIANYFYINSILTTYYLGINLYNYAAPFVDCDINNIASPGAYLRCANQIYYHPYLVYALYDFSYPILISNSKSCEGNYRYKPKEIYLSNELLRGVYVENDVVTNYLFDEELNSELETIYIVTGRQNTTTFSYDKNDDAHFYIDLANSKIYYRQSVLMQNGEHEYKYIKLLNMNEKCKVVVIEKYDRYAD